MEFPISEHAFQPVLESIHRRKLRNESNQADESEFDDLPDVPVTGHKLFAFAESDGEFAFVRIVRGICASGIRHDVCACRDIRFSRFGGNVLCVFRRLRDGVFVDFQHHILPRYR